MQIFHSLSDFAKTGKKSAVALGFFDGVHLGHRKVISRMTENARDLAKVVLTFSESPAAALGQEPPGLLTDNERKAELLAGLGVDAVIFADFFVLKDMPPKAFVKTVLKDTLHAEKVFCGFNYRFGKGGAADGYALAALGEPYGIETRVCSGATLDGEEISSTRIRALLEAGKPEKAAELLGAPFALTGAIHGGNHVGSALGFPTVNQLFPPGSVIPKYGVYASRVTVGEKTYIGATNIGVHPTVKEKRSPLCETNILDFEGGTLYGAAVKTELLRFIRPERKFDSLFALQSQIESDCEAIRTAFLDEY